MGAPGRIASMDQFRGYTVAGMFVVNFLGGLTAVTATWPAYFDKSDRAKVRQRLENPAISVPNPDYVATRPWEQRDRPRAAVTRRWSFCH